jgi:hypothetical protein
MPIILKLALVKAAFFSTSNDKSTYGERCKRKEYMNNLILLLNWSIASTTIGLKKYRALPSVL